MPIRAGDLDRRVVLERPQATQNASGEPIITWSIIDTVWAAVWPLRGQERFTAQQVNSDVDTRIRIRYREDVDPTCRVRQGNDIWDIDAVLEMGRQEGLEMLCSTFKPES